MQASNNLEENSKKENLEIYIVFCYTSSGLVQHWTKCLYLAWFTALLFRFSEKPER